MQACDEEAVGGPAVTNVGAAPPSAELEDSDERARLEDALLQDQTSGVSSPLLTRRAVLLAALLVTVAVTGLLVWIPSEAGWRAMSKMWGDNGCASSSEHCAEKGCCASEGMRCYRKNEFWAGCLYTCTPGQSPDVDPEPGPWDCAEISSPVPRQAEEPPKDAAASEAVAEAEGAFCSAPGEDCSEKRCCANPGFQCYRKNAEWASCLRTCTNGYLLNGDPFPEPWECEKLGDRTDEPRDSDTVVCAQRGQDCRSHRCCSGRADRCFLRDEWYGQCMPSCDPGEHATTGWSCEKAY